MTFDQLRIFVAVAEREHLTEAAMALRLTPSAVSAAIHALESRYGANLFNRVGRRIELSADGRAFLPEARRALTGAALARQALSELGGLARGSLTIAASQTSASYWLPPILVRFRIAHPAVTLTLLEGNTTTVADAVQGGNADLGVIEGEIDRPALAVTKVDTDRLILVAAPDHPLAKTEHLGGADVAAASFIMREEGSGTRTVFEQALRTEGIDPKQLDVMLELPTNEAICAALRESPCLAALSDLVARPHIEAARLKELRYAIPPRAFALLRHKERFKTRASQALELLIGETVRAAAAKRAAASFDI